MHENDGAGEERGVVVMEQVRSSEQTKLAVQISLNDDATQA